jgi:DNA-binding HxlR family transcriptional regulator
MSAVTGETASHSIDMSLLGEDCPVRRVLDVIGDKWTPIILYCLSAEARRFSELQRFIPDISKKMLAQVLRQLETDGLVQRTVYPTVPTTTDYRLTETGRRLHEPVALLCRWAEHNADLLAEVSAARQATSRST